MAVNTGDPEQPDGLSRTHGVARPRFADLTADALRYWEPRRLFYNAVLLTVVCVHFYAGWPNSKSIIARDPLFLLFFLAVLANVAYCAAYAIDLFVQFSGLHSAWTRWRSLVLIIGTAFAAVIAHFFTLGIMANGAGD